MERDRTHKITLNNADERAFQELCISFGLSGVDTIRKLIRDASAGRQAEKDLMELRQHMDGLIDTMHHDVQDHVRTAVNTMFIFMKHLF